jgi:molybdopterin-guanine dinucleotide biosynthesis protein A
MATNGPAALIRFTGAVLCGGASRRMGRDKATLPVDDRPMAARVADALRSAGAADVVAIGGDAPALTALGLAVVPDDEPGGGPLPATITALAHASEEVVVVLACDLVAPHPAAIRAVVETLATSPDATMAAVPVVDGQGQWTHAAWRTSAVHALRAARQAGVASLHGAVEDLPYVAVSGLRAADVADADRPGDLPIRR